VILVVSFLKASQLSFCSLIDICDVFDVVVVFVVH